VLIMVTVSAVTAVGGAVTVLMTVTVAPPPVPVVGLPVGAALGKTVMVKVVTWSPPVMVRVTVWAGGGGGTVTVVTCPSLSVAVETTDVGTVPVTVTTLVTTDVLDPSLTTRVSVE
jgi:hypothetical protein